MATAETAYRWAVAARPRDAEARHYLGILLCQTGRVESGLGDIERSLALDPDAAEFRNNLGQNRTSEWL